MEHSHILSDVNSIGNTISKQAFFLAIFQKKLKENKLKESEKLKQLFKKLK